MLHLSIPATEIFDRRNEVFKTIGGAEVDLEYSLFTISRWEMKYHKPYISTADKLRRDEVLGLYKAMCMTENIGDDVWLGITGKLEKKIFEYMSDPMSATVINKKIVESESHPKSGRRRQITTELIYFQMATLGIPYTCEHWHFNRLMTLIELAALENAPPKKMSKADVAKAWREQNSQMRSKTRSRG